MSFPVGTRVVVTHLCSWEDRIGKFGTVTDVTRYSVHVKLDDEDVFFDDGGTAAFFPDSLRVAHRSEDPTRL